MTIDQVRKLHRAEPFRPFRIHLVDRRSFDIASPEMVAINEPRQFIAVAHNSVFEIIDVQCVTSLKTL